MDTGVKAAAGEGATGEVGVVVASTEGGGVTMREMTMGGKSAGHALEDAPDQDPGKVFYLIKLIFAGNFDNKFQPCILNRS